MTIAMRHVVKFPANVQATKGVDVARLNGTFSFRLNYANLTPAATVASNVQVAFQDPATGAMGVTTLASALNSNANIQAIANADTEADRLGYWNGANSYVLAPFTTYARTLLDDESQDAARVTLGLTPGIDVQSYSSNLESFASKTAPSGDVIGTTDTQTLTGKTIDGATNTLKNIPGLPSGGTMGQVLAKASGTDADTRWTDAGAGDMIKAAYDPGNLHVNAFDLANIATFTRSDSLTKSIPAPQLSFRTSGYSSPGVGAANYVRISTPSPAEAWHHQSADGAWWALSEESPCPQMLGAVGDGATDDVAKIQDTIDYCLSFSQPKAMSLTAMHNVASSIIVNRAVGGAHAADTFRIAAVGKFAGFTTSASIAIIDTTLPYLGGTGPSSCNVRFEGVTFLGTGNPNTFAVSDKFVKVHFEGCRFNAIRCVLATYYLQSWRWHHCSMIAWSGIFCSNVETYYDCRWESCDFESGGDGIKSFNGGFDGSSIINCLFENSGQFFFQNKGLGTTIIGNYTEGNSKPDYVLSDISNGGYQRGTVFQGNFMSGNTHTNYNVVVGDSQGMLAGGNYTDAKLYDTTGTTPGSFKSIGDYAGISKFSTAGSFTLDHAGDYVEGNLSSGSATPLTAGTAKTITSISLPAGDWDVSGVVGYIPAGTTSVTRYSSSISLTANTVGGDGNSNIDVFAAFVSGGFAVDYPTPTVRVSVSTTTTVYLIGFADFTVSTMTAFGKIRARKAGEQ